MFNQILLWTVLIFPWILLIFFDKNKIKRFIPAGLFSALIMTIIFQLAERLNWWVVKETIFPLTNMTPFVYSFYIVAPVIVLYFTFNNFLIYMLVNAIIDAIYIFGITKWLEYLGIYEINNINSFGRFLIVQIVAVLIYLFQKWQDSSFSNHSSNS
jgi:hypothetical protein